MICVTVGKWFAVKHDESMWQLVVSFIMPTFWLFPANALSMFEGPVFSLTSVHGLTILTSVEVT